MSFKRTIPYFLTSAAMLFGSGSTMGSNEKSASDSTYADTTKTTLNVQPKSVNAPDTVNADYNFVSYDMLAQEPVSAIAQRYDVVYTRANGNKFKRSGGTRAWRNNNPGCIRYSDFAAEQGAIGKAGGFAVFPDEETGRRAIAELLKSDKYCNLSIGQAITKYAPPHENDTQNYKYRLRKMTGLDINKKIRDLTPEQMERVVNAICIVEGWREGHEIALQPINKSEHTDTANTFAMAAQNTKINQLRQHSR